MQFELTTRKSVKDEGKKGEKQKRKSPKLDSFKWGADPRRTDPPQGLVSGSVSEKIMGKKEWKWFAISGIFIVLKILWGLRSILE